MRRFLTIIVLALGVSAAAFAQGPVITAVLDAGGYTANLAPGMVFVVKGTNLCGGAYVQATLPYTTAALNAVTISLTPVAGGAALAAYIIYTYNGGSATQLAAVLPSTAATGDYNVTVTNNGSTSPSFKITVVVRKFQLMTQAGSGSGRALAQNVVSASQYDVNGYTTGPVAGTPYTRSPGKQAQILIAWGVGLGAAVGFDASGPPNGLNFLSQGLDVKAIVGGMQIAATYAGRSSFPGLDNIYFTLPANVPTGCYVSFQVVVAGQYSNLTTVSIAPNAAANTCVDPQYTQSTLSSLDAGGSLTVGYFGLTSYAFSLSLSGQTITTLTEGSSGLFAKFTADTISQVPSGSTAALATGGCYVYRTTTSSSTSTGGSGGTLTLLDAGSVTLNGPNVANKAYTQTNNAYSLTLSSFFPPSTTAVIAPGTYTVKGLGGKDIGAFTASLNVPQPLTVTGGLPATVVRSQDLPLAWTGGGTSLVVITGEAAVQTGGTAQSPVYDAGIFTCITTADKGSFTVPTGILSQLPAASASAIANGTAIGLLLVTTNTVPAASNGLFTAPLTAGGSTDFAFFTSSAGAAATPAYQ